MVTQYFGELYLGTLIKFLLVSVRNVQSKGRNLTSMKTLRKTKNIACACIHQPFAFPNMVLSNPEYSKAVCVSCMFEHLATFWFNLICRII